MDVRLHIDRLVLDGFSIPAGQGARIARAAEVELARLIARDGVSSAVAAGFAAPALNCGAIPAGAQLDPVSFGTELGRALYAGIGRPDP